METDDVRRDYETLRAQGVTFRKEPTEEFYGIEDDSGNWFSFTQRTGAECRVEQPSPGGVAEAADEPRLAGLNAVERRPAPPVGRPQVIMQ
ncbi:MAG: VOC family protein, partial [Acidimicrobiales bacterium]